MNRAGDEAVQVPLLRRSLLGFAACPADDILGHPGTGLLCKHAGPGTNRVSVSLPRVTFGLIVLNGEPFLRYNLRAIYPFAHQIIVVEGACPGAATNATPDGHSVDGTLEVLRRFKDEEDPRDKLEIVTRDGFWPEKDEQSRAYADRATGDYLWQVDVDEFYQPEHMRAVLEMLGDDPAITAASFKQVAFWGGFDCTVDSWDLRRGSEVFHRLFRWGPGYRYTTHRPPTVCNERGRDLRSIKWLGARELARRGIVMNHYCLVFPKQVREKCSYYTRAGWNCRPDSSRWAERDYFKLRNAFRVHNVYEWPSWLERHAGFHPPSL